MDRRRVRKVVFMGLLFVGLTLAALAGADPGRAEGGTPSAPTVVLRAASGASLRFRTQNGQVADGLAPDTRDVPHLVLHRNGVLTDPAERTLIVQVAGIEVPPAGVTVTLTLQTQHGDPDLPGATPQRIVARRESLHIANTAGVTQVSGPVTWSQTFGDRVVPGPKAFTTPTDYYRWELTVTDAMHGPDDPLYASSQSYAFLLEDQWVVPLPRVAEASPGAAPDEMVVYYADMFPFRKSPTDPTTWLRREQVTEYVGSELVPAMVEAFRVQSDGWGFPWYEEWSGYRPGSDQERLSVALSDGETWFHGKAPGLGDASMSLTVSRGGAEYETLTDGLISTFHHELFHNVQRSILGHYGDGHGGRGWPFFIEGMAELASSVGQPAVEFSRSWGLRDYAVKAAGYVGQAGMSEGDLNRGYEQMSGYHAAAYWRYLYEQCGGMAGGVEDPASGMEVIRRALIALARVEMTEGGAQASLVERMPGIMDQALDGASCPFRTFEESLQGFGRAVYGLRLAAGRCTLPGLPTGCGLYDPEGLYPIPPAGRIIYGGTTKVYGPEEEPYPAGIPSSFGIDLVEVALDTSVSGQGLVIELDGAAGAKAEFTLEVLYLVDPGDGSRPRLVPGRAAAPAARVATDPDGRATLVLPRLDTARANLLGLIITRTDAREKLDPAGSYTVTLRTD